MENLFAPESPEINKPRLTKPMLVALALVATISLSTFISKPPKLPALPTIQSLYELISERSPGERTTARSTKPKRGKARAEKPAKPRQRALGKINRPPLTAVVPEPLLELLTQPRSVFSEPIVTQEPLDVVALLPQVALSGGVVGGASSSGGGGGVVGGGSGPGGDGAGGNSDQPGAVTPPVSPVPEPSTWAMMIIGFGLCAAALRRRSVAMLSSA